MKKTKGCFHSLEELEIYERLLHTHVYEPLYSKVEENVSLACFAICTNNCVLIMPSEVFDMYKL